MKITYVISESNKNEKLVDVLRHEMDFSSRLIRLLKREKRVSVNGHKLSFNASMRNNDEIVVEMPEEENIFAPEEMDIEVLYEDEHLMVVNKAPFIVVHPTKGHPYGTLANGLANYMLSKDEHYKIRFANRLDRDTSGAMVICKTGLAQKIVSDQMLKDSILKQYIAIVEGVMPEDKGIINEPIGNAYEDSVERIVRSDGKASITHYEVLERFVSHTKVLVTLKTGRTHQIRVHLKHIGHTIVGDVLYGGDHTLIDRQALHSTTLGFKNLNGEALMINAPLKDDMNALIERLK